MIYKRRKPNSKLALLLLAAQLIVGCEKDDLKQKAANEIAVPVTEFLQKFAQPGWSRSDIRAFANFMREEGVRNVFGTNQISAIDSSAIDSLYHHWWKMKEIHLQKSGTIWAQFNIDELEAATVAKDLKSATATTETWYQGLGTGDPYTEDHYFLGHRKWEFEMFRSNINDEWQIRNISIIEEKIKPYAEAEEAKINITEEVSSTLKAFVRDFAQPKWSQASVDSMSRLMTEDGFGQLFSAPDISALSPFERRRLVDRMHYHWWETKKPQFAKLKKTSLDSVSSYTKTISSARVTVSYDYLESKKSLRKQAMEFNIIRFDASEPWKIESLQLLTDEAYSFAQQVFRLWSYICLLGLAFWLARLILPYLTLFTQFVLELLKYVSMVVTYPVQLLGGLMGNWLGWVIILIILAIVGEKLGGEIFAWVMVIGLIGFALYFISKAITEHWSSIISALQWPTMFIIWLMMLGTILLLANQLFDSVWYIGMAVLIQILAGMYLTVGANLFRTLLIVTFPLIVCLPVYYVSDAYVAAAIVGGVITLALLMMNLKALFAR